jgi:predicted transcriptional regulator of viral defense system
MNSQQTKLLALFRQRKLVSTSDARKVLGKPQAGYDLQCLQNEGLIHRVKHGVYAQYRQKRK